MTLHERIAKVLDWDVKDVQSFSLLTLREMVRKEDPKLAEEISARVQAGAYLFAHELKRRSL